jgi:hypothetical protein
MLNIIYRIFEYIAHRIKIKKILNIDDATTKKREDKIG